MAAVMRKLARKVGQGRIAKNLANHTGMEGNRFQRRFLSKRDMMRVLF